MDPDAIVTADGLPPYRYPVGGVTVHELGMRIQPLKPVNDPNDVPEHIVDAIDGVPVYPGAHTIVHTLPPAKYVPAAVQSVLPSVIVYPVTLVTPAHRVHPVNDDGLDEPALHDSTPPFDGIGP